MMRSGPTMERLARSLLRPSADEEEGVGKPASSRSGLLFVKLGNIDTHLHSLASCPSTGERASTSSHVIATPPGLRTLFNAARAQPSTCQCNGHCCGKARGSRAMDQEFSARTAWRTAWA